jgi:acyl carrier protein
VVARPGTQPTQAELRRFVSLRLADYKVPRQVLVLDEIPKGPTGKVQRIGLAEKLGLGAEQSRPVSDYSPPANEIEALLAELWQAVLLRQRVGRHDRFLDLGGDSLLATELVARVGEAFQLELSILEFFDAPTVAEQAALVEASMKYEL